MGLVIRGQEVIVHLVSWADLSALPSFFYFLPPYTFIEYLCETGDGRNEWDSPVGNTKPNNRLFTIQGGELTLEVYSGHAKNPTPRLYLTVADERDAKDSFWIQWTL